MMAETKLGTLDRDETIAAMRSSLNVFAAISVPHIYRVAYPPVFDYIWSLLIAGIDKQSSHLGLGIPRGFMKTTVTKLFLLYLILFTKKKYIMIVACTQEKAQTILGDVVDLLSSPNIIAIFGNLVSDCKMNNAKMFQATIGNRVLIMQAIGSGTDPRGSNVNWGRPDVIVCDDIQSRENVKSPAQATALIEWFDNTLYYVRDEEHCMYIFLGNLFPSEYCLLQRLRSTTLWTTFITGAVLADGTALWEEFKPLARIQGELKSAIENGTVASYCAELLNDYSAARRVPPSADDILHAPLTQLADNSTGGYVIIDPAGTKSTSDDTAIGAAVIVDGIPYLIDYASKVMNPKETIIYALELCAKYDITLILVEAYSYQASLIYWFEKVLEELGIFGITCLPITRGSKAKNRAILDMVESLRGKLVGLSTEILYKVISMIIAFQPEHKNNKDDVLDVLVYTLLAQVLYPVEANRVVYSSYEDDSISPESVTSLL